MMLPYRKHIQPQLVGQADLLHEVTQPLMRTDLIARYRMRTNIAKRTNSDLHNSMFKHQ
jgi:hypothetical protein